MSLNGDLEGLTDPSFDWESLLNSAEAFAIDNWDYSAFGPIIYMERNSHLSIGGQSARLFERAWREMVVKTPEARVIWAWHGSSSECIQSICKSGFDTNRRKNQLYGRGEYFGATCGVSKFYNKGAGELLLCVLLPSPLVSFAARCMYVVNNPTDSSMHYCAPLLVVGYSYVRSLEFLLNAPLPVQPYIPFHYSTGNLRVVPSVGTSSSSTNATTTSVTSPSASSSSLPAPSMPSVIAPTSSSISLGSLLLKNEPSSEICTQIYQAYSWGAIPPSYLAQTAPIRPEQQSNTVDNPTEATSPSSGYTNWSSRSKASQGSSSITLVVPLVESSSRCSYQPQGTLPTTALALGGDGTSNQVPRKKSKGFFKRLFGRS